MSAVALIRCACNLEFPADDVEAHKQHLMSGRHALRMRVIETRQAYATRGLTPDCELEVQQALAAAPFAVRDDAFVPANVETQNVPSQATYLPLWIQHVLSLLPFREERQHFIEAVAQLTAERGVEIGAMWRLGASAEEIYEHVTGRPFINPYRKEKKL